MKKFKIIAITAFIGLIMGLSGTISAQGWKGQGGMRAAGNGQQAGSRNLLRTDMSNACVEVLAELSDQSTETIKSKLEYKPLWAVIDEFKVDYKVYKTKMDAKAKELVQKLVDDGKMTQTQADFMKEKMDQDQGFGQRGKGRRGGNGVGRRNGQ